MARSRILVNASSVESSASGSVCRYFSVVANRSVAKALLDGLEVGYIPTGIADGQGIALPDTGPTGLYQRLAAGGYQAVRFVEQIKARYPRPDEAAFLGLIEAQHLIEVTRIAYANNDPPVETVINVFPSPRAGLRRTAAGAGTLHHCGGIGHL